MRGYSISRFNGKAAIYYSAEYRMIPRWHPLGDVPLAQEVGLKKDYWQIVSFVEGGCVADTWSIPKLHRSMKVDAGVKLRATCSDSARCSRFG